MMEGKHEFKICQLLSSSPSFPKRSLIFRKQEKCFKVSLSTYKEPAPEINDIWNVKGAKETEISVRELIYLDKEIKPQKKVKLLRK